MTQKWIGMTQKWIGWHFLSADRMTRFEPRVKVRKGSLLHETRRLVMCNVGLHASLRAIDALKYAPGPIVCRVELRGERIDDEEKSCASERKVIAIADATMTLHEFACWCAETALRRERKAGREPDKRSWNAVRVKRRWLRGDATDDELESARATAWVAAWASVAAARAAGAASWESAVESARVSARVAAGEAWEEARAAQNRKLESMLRKLLGCK